MIRANFFLLKHSGYVSTLAINHQVLCAEYKNYIIHKNYKIEVLIQVAKYSLL
jgi:hypothetical protein